MANLIKHYLISGRVQGVGYRAFTQRTGLELQLSGWVRNLNDGRVEAIAQGPAEILVQFEARLRQGPRMSIVESVVCEELNSNEAHGAFEVRKDGVHPCVKP